MRLGGSLALLWELSNYRIGFGARFAFCCDFSRVELGFKVLQFVFGDVLPRGMRSGVLLRPSNLLSVSGSAWRVSHYALYEHGRGKRAHPIYQRVFGPRAKPGARRLPKLSL